MSGPIIPWVSKTKPIKDGEQVKAEVANRHALQLQQRTDHLKGQLDRIAAGEALYGRNVAVAESVLAGHAVYWNAESQEYQLALAKVEFNAMLGGYVLAESTYVVGMCIYKYSDTRADIVLFGLAREFDITNSAGVSGFDTADAGAYYLSASTAGKITKQKPPVSVFVATVRGDGAVHVNPTPRDLLESHIHYAFDLVANPSGQVECPEVNEQYVFDTIDTAEAGWLPVSEFDESIVPEGALLGYNLPLHPELERIWPPTPGDSVYIEKDGIGVPRGHYIANIHGLWWFNTCYGEAPWPAEPRACGEGDSSLSSSSLSSDTTESCAAKPVLEQQGFVRHNPFSTRLRIYFTKMVFKTSDAMVTSLQPATDSPIKVLNCSGEDARTGDLYLDIDLGRNVTENDDQGFALKDVEGTEYKRGRVISAIKAGSNVQLSGGTLGDDDYRSGLVTVSAVSDANLLGDADLVALNGVQEQNVNNVFYLAFPQSRLTSIRLRISLPLDGVPEGAKLKLRLWLMAKATATALPPLQASYRVIPAPDGCNELSLPTTDTDLADVDASGCGTLNANQYIEIDSEEIDVENGDVVFFTLQREGDSDGYPADVGLLRANYQLVVE